MLQLLHRNLGKSSAPLPLAWLPSLLAPPWYLTSGHGGGWPGSVCNRPWLGRTAQANQHLPLLKIPSQATLGSHCIGVVGHIPSWISLAILFLRYTLSPLWRRRPIWLRKFAAEESFEPAWKSPGSWTRSLTLLFTLSLVGLGMGLYPLLDRGLCPIHSILNAPCVSQVGRAHARFHRGPSWWMDDDD